MSDRVPSDEIEAIVGTYRRLDSHVARCVDEEEMVYILHSYVCLHKNADLRDCEYYLALDAGIDRTLFDELPTIVGIRGGKLVPVRLLTLASD